MQCLYTGEGKVGKFVETLHVEEPVLRVQLLYKFNHQSSISHIP